MTQTRTSSLEGHQPAEEGSQHQGQAEQTGSSGRSGGRRLSVGKIRDPCSGARTGVSHSLYFPNEQVIDVE